MLSPRNCLSSSYCPFGFSLWLLISLFLLFLSFSFLLCALVFSFLRLLLLSSFFLWSLCSFYLNLFSRILIVFWVSFFNLIFHVILCYFLNWLKVLYFRYWGGNLVYWRRCNGNYVVLLLLLSLLLLSFCLFYHSNCCWQLVVVSVWGLYVRLRQRNILILLTTVPLFFHSPPFLIPPLPYYFLIFIV